jgi:hypothetical protein
VSSYCAHYVCWLCLSAKYQRPGMIPVLSIVDAFDKFMDVNVMPNAERDNPSGFRTTYLVTEKVDVMLRSNLQALDKVIYDTCVYELHFVRMLTFMVAVCVS